jgi:hypothetical protein
VQLVQISPWREITPVNSPWHWQVQAPAAVALLLAGQGEHRFCALDASKVPGAQSVQFSASLGIPDPVWYLPGPHSRHAADEIWPASSWYVPFTHRLQFWTLGIPAPVW